MALSDAEKKERKEYLDNNLKITQLTDEKPYVFISYASDNWKKVFKDVVVPMQKKYGLRVFADKAFDDVNDQWVLPMQKNLGAADMMIAFLSQHYIESYACFLELLTAVSDQKKIVFVTLGETLRHGNAKDEPNIENSVKKRIIMLGNNISTDTPIMKAMNTAYINKISVLLENDSLSKHAISDAFISFIKEFAPSRKDINNIGAIKKSIESVSSAVFDESSIVGEKPEPEPQEPITGGGTSSGNGGGTGSGKGNGNGGGNGDGTGGEIEITEPKPEMPKPEPPVIENGDIYYLITERNVCAVVKYDKINYTLLENSRIKPTHNNVIPDKAKRNFEERSAKNSKGDRLITEDITERSHRHWQELFLVGRRTEKI